MRGTLPRLYLVTSDEVVARADFLAQARQAMAAGRDSVALQLRAHELSGHRFWELARQLRADAVEHGASFWINDRVDVALAVRADGVQLGVRSLAPGEARRQLGAGCWIGCSVHGVAEAGRAASAGADLLVLGNIYPTASHPGRPGLGLEVIARVGETGRPIIAIGGITAERVNEVLEAGAEGVAVLSGVWGMKDVAASVAGYLEALGGRAKIGNDQTVMRR